VPRDLLSNRVNRRTDHRITAAPARGAGDDRPRARDHVLGDRDEGAVGSHLAAVSLGRGHPLNLLHAAPG
jgi:hypothetical protein